MSELTRTSTSLAINFSDVEIQIKANKIAIIHNPRSKESPPKTLINGILSARFEPLKDPTSFATKPTKIKSPMPTTIDMNNNKAND